MLKFHQKLVFVLTFNIGATFNQTIRVFEVNSGSVIKQSIIYTKPIQTKMCKLIFKNYKLKK